MVTCSCYLTLLCCVSAPPPYAVEPCLRLPSLQSCGRVAEVAEHHCNELDAFAYVGECLRELQGHPIRSPHTCILLASVLPRESEVSQDRKIPERRYCHMQATLASDASDDSVAAFCVDGLPSFEFFYSLTEEEASWSSSQRELLAFQKVLEVEGELLCSKGPITLWWLTDNTNVCKFLSKGSGRPYIMRQIFSLFKTACAMQLDIRPIWVSRDNPFLQHADGLSKMIDTDNWAVAQGDFDNLKSLFGPFTVDLFATAANAKVERFFSFTHECDCSAVDAFSADWVGELAYVAPPVSLVSLHFVSLHFVPFHFVPGHFVPVTLSRSLCPGHFVPWSLCPGSLCPLSLCPLVTLSPGHFVPGHFVPGHFVPRSLCPLSHFVPGHFVPWSLCPRTLCFNKTGIFQNGIFQKESFRKEAFRKYVLAKLVYFRMKSFRKNHSEKIFQKHLSEMTFLSQLLGHKVV
jgi:hypothetical protein